MLSKEILRQIAQIEMKAGFLARDVLAGEYASAFKGQGMEFDEVREYVPGDDVRTIDWNVTARMRHPFVKIYREEREMTLMLLVDVSASQQFGSTGRHKRAMATELAAILAFLAIRNNDKVGLIVFSDHVEQFIPPKKGRAHVWHIIREVLTFEPRGRGTDVGQALDYLMRVTKRRASCFLISDFLASDFERRLQVASRKHDLVCVRVEDPREAELPAAGIVELVDLEDGRMRALDTSNPQVRARWAASWNERREQLLRLFRRGKIDSFAVSTATPVVDALVAYLRQRERRRVR